jgi:ribonuclease BN (tRNA processing enzyme)
MLEVVFLGVGEAFDENNPNTSILLKIDQQGGIIHMLLDCGFSVPAQFWKEVRDPDLLDCIWISHFHADHFMGVPPLLVRFWEEGRKRPLTIMGQQGIKEKIISAIELSYPGFGDKIRFSLEFMEVEPFGKRDYKGLVLSSAENDHSKRDLALRIDMAVESIFYSGDGKATPSTRNLASGSSLLIHEAFTMEQEIPGHGTVLGAMEMAKETGAHRLALVHIQRNERAMVMKRLRYLMKDHSLYQIIMPENMERLFF